MTRRSVAIFTGNRAEYGLQYPILRAVDRHPDLDYRLLVSGAHLDPRFGQTRDEILRDGFRIDREIRIEMDGASLLSTAQAIGSGILSISTALAELKPDILVVYADRFESFAAVIAASQMGIATAHIEGGDLTEGGALDDTVRHAMTKLAHLHFTTNQQATNRVLAMGEEPWRVHTVGLPAVDLIVEGQHADMDEVLRRLRLDRDRPVVLFTQHAVATDFAMAAEHVRPSLAALTRLAAEGVQCILTYPNNDAGGQQVIAELEAVAQLSLANLQVHPSLGRHLYHGVLALARDPQMRVACAGNSSSGLKETPAFGCPTVNIGPRQDGRLRAQNVIDVPYSEADITSALRRCLFDGPFRSACRTAQNPYWYSYAGPKIADVLAGVDLGPKLIRKRMTLAGEAREGWFR